MKKYLKILISLAFAIILSLSYITINAEEENVNNSENENAEVDLTILKSLLQTSATTNKLSLKWNAVDEANGYFVQVKSGKKWKTVKTIKNNDTTTVTIKKLNPSTKYTYRVVAYVTIKKKNETINTTDTVTAVTAPSSPKTSIKSSTYNSIKINIKKSKGASKYEIYRSTTKNGVYVKINETTSTSYLDENLTTGKTYYYKVKACNNYCSAYSKVINKKTSLAKPSLRVKSYYSGQATIIAGTIPGEDGYIIERSTKKNKGFKKVTDLDVDTKSFVDEANQKSKKTYYYRIKAYKVVDGAKVYSGYSKVVSVKISTKKIVKLKSISLSADNKIAINTSKFISVTYNPKEKKEDITWTSSDDSIATVVNSIITTHKVGDVVITATTTSGITSNIIIKVYKPAESFELNENNISMFVNDTKELFATITPDDATYKMVNWRSQNTNVATVDSNGVVTAIAEGTTKIIATTEEGLTRECTIVVKEKPIEYSGTGDSIVSNINIPAGHYVAHIAFETSEYNSAKFYYGSGEYDYELLVNEVYSYSGTVLLKGEETLAVTNGILEIKTDGAWTVSIEKLTGTLDFPASGSGDVVTGLFDGTGKQEIFDVSFDTDGYHGLYIYKYNGNTYDHELLVNEAFKSYSGEVMFSTEKGAKYFLVVKNDGAWSIKRKNIPSSVSFPITGDGSSVTGLFDGTGERITFNVTFDSDGYNGLHVYKYNGGYFDHKLLVNETDPYTGQVLVSTEKGAKYFFVVDTDSTWSISK